MDTHEASGDRAAVSPKEILSDVDAPALARRTVSGWLSGHTRLIDLLLVTSELVTSAVRHGAHGGTLSLTLESAAPVWIMVEYPADGPGAPRSFDEDSIRQGLMIVDKVADRWGIEQIGGRIGVWFEIG